MVTSQTLAQSRTVTRQPLAFEEIGGVAAFLAGLVGFLYAVAFIILKNAGISALFLMLSGLFALVALVALYGRLRRVDESAALLGLLFGLAGALGALIHGGYDLANAMHPPAAFPALPNAVDPRGLLALGVAGLGLLVISWLIGRDRGLPSGLGTLGYLAGLLLVVLYVGRLVVLDAANPVILVPAVLGGFLVNPAWYLWLGRTLLRHRDLSPAEATAQRLQN